MDGLSRLTDKVDYKNFLSRLDMKWDPMVHRGGRYYPEKNPESTRCDWGEAALVGNGMIGAAIYKKTVDGITLELGRNDVEAHNNLKGVDWCVPRVPIGDVVLSCAEKVKKETMKLSLYDALVTGEILTEKGKVAWSCFSDAVRDVMVLSVESEGEATPNVSLIPAYGISPRMVWAKEESIAAAAPLPPKPTKTNADGTELSVQEFVNDEGEISGECAVAVKEQKISHKESIYYISIAHSRENGIARKQVIQTVNEAVSIGKEALLEEHEQWWHNYYPQSFVSFSDTRWEAFYYIQMYKLASTTRGNLYEAIDNQGIWLTDTSWPGTWWNLNVQLSYSPICKANRTDLMKSLLNTIEQNKEQMKQNAAPITGDGIYMGRSSGRLCGGNTMPSYEAIMKGNLHIFEMGNFTWIIMLLYNYARSIMDKELLVNKVYPLLRSNMNIALKLLHRWEDGKLHLPQTTSPEYPNPKNPEQRNSCPAHDTSYDLALIRWGLETLLRIYEENQLSDSLYDTWKETLRDLSPLCINENGIMVARDLPFEVSHRHYSHLFAIYPLHLMDLENKEEFELAQKSMLHWISKKGALEGYSYTGSAAMAATMGDGNLALECLNGLREYLLPNTMYIESGGPVIETPLSGAESLHYMLLQTVNDTVRVFPAVPDVFENVEFAQLLAEGAFEVSGKRESTENKWVYVTSKAGEPLRIMPNLSGPVKAYSTEAFTMVPDGEGVYKISLAKGQSILLYTGDIRPEISVSPVSSEKEFENFYGSLKPQMGACAQYGLTKVRLNTKA